MADPTPIAAVPVTYWVLWDGTNSPAWTTFFQTIVAFGSAPTVTYDSGSVILSWADHPDNSVTYYSNTAFRIVTGTGIPQAGPNPLTMTEAQARLNYSPAAPWPA
jgi:hypothetical protein